MLTTDWLRASTIVLSRFAGSPRRAVLDPDHALARWPADEARELQPKPACCRRNGILWDLETLYPAYAVWGWQPACGALFNGAISR
jgi:hypothetical protein